MKFTVLALLASAAAAIDSSAFKNVVPLATFDGTDKKTTWGWKILNDPVMGGQSHATLDVSNNLAVWNGTCAIVPKLSAPGFSNVETTDGFGVFGGFANDASKATHFVMRVKSSIPYTGFKVSVAADTINPQFKCHKADINIPVSSDFIEVSVPFTEFSNNWSAYTGEAKVKCADDKSVCLTEHNLSHITQIGLWAEGVEGDFHMEIESIYAGVPTASFYNMVAEAEPPKFKSVCSGNPQKNLRYSMSLVDDRLQNLPIDPSYAQETLVEAICCDAAYDDLAEPNSLFASPDVDFLNKLSSSADGTTFYDSVCGVPLFHVKQARYAYFKDETTEHGWPSFRPEDLLDKLSITADGHVYSSCGTHLGSLLPDAKGDRYCLDLVCVSGNPVSVEAIY